MAVDCRRKISAARPFSKFPRRNVRITRKLLATCNGQMFDMRERRKGHKGEAFAKGMREEMKEEAKVGMKRE